MKKQRIKIEKNKNEKNNGETKNYNWKIKKQIKKLKIKN